MASPTDARSPQAATRAAGLIRQLLALGRRQVLEAGRLDLSAAVGGMREGMRSLLGPGPDLSFALGAGLPPVLADRALGSAFRVFFPAVDSPPPAP